MSSIEKATLAAGCFWCIEAVFELVEGVDRVISGYTGGDTINPSYEEICSGTTGHAEAVEVYYDQSILDYQTVLEIFFSYHDPTTLNRQGADVGTQYRSAIFYNDESQKDFAEKKGGLMPPLPFQQQLEDAPPGDVIRGDRPLMPPVPGGPIPPIPPGG